MSDQGRLTLLRKTLKELEDRKRSLLAAGECLTGVSLDSSRPGGQRQTQNLQHRLRWTEGGKSRSRYVRAEEVEQVSRAIARGRELKKTERAIADVQKQIQKIEAIALKLGLKLLDD